MVGNGFANLIWGQRGIREEFFPNVAAGLHSCVAATGDSRNITTFEAKSLAIPDIMTRSQDVSSGFLSQLQDL